MLWIFFSFNINEIITKNIKALLWISISLSLFILIIIISTSCFDDKSKRKRKKYLIVYIIIYEPCIVIFCLLLSKYVEFNHLIIMII